MPTPFSRDTPPKVTKRFRLTVTDLLLFASLTALILYAVYRINDVLIYHWNWSRIFNFVLRFDEDSGSWVPNLLLHGLATTLRLAVWATVLATIIGLIMGYWRTCNNLTLRIISRCFVELIRNIPPVVFIFIFYFFISSQLFPAVGLEDINREHGLVNNAVFRFLFGEPALLTNFLAGMLCLAIFEAAYITEIVRAGIQSLPSGQWEAAKAIGLSRTNTLRDIILPQAIRKILPPLAGQFITLIKDSAIVSLISIQELTFLATEVASSTTKVFETWILVAGMYFILCFGFAVVFKHLEARAARTKH